MTAPFYATGGSGVTALPRWRDRLLHLLLPAPCLGCGGPQPAAFRRVTLGLCTGCRGRLRPVPARGCSACGLPLPAPALLIMPPAAPAMALRATELVPGTLPATPAVVSWAACTIFRR